MGKKELITFVLGILMVIAALNCLWGGGLQIQTSNHILNGPLDIDQASLSENESLTFVAARTQSPDTIDPAIAYGRAPWEIIQNLYETLIWYDHEDPNDLIPMLSTSVPTVENGGISLDGFTYTFQIREDVYFHNGPLLTGYDVEYSIERVLTMNDLEGQVWIIAPLLYPDWPGPGVILDPSIVESTITVDPSDPYMVSFHLAEPHAGFLQILTLPVASIISMDYVEAHGGVEPVTKNEWMSSHEAGTGPFLQSILNETNVVLDRFEYYWGVKAALNQVIIRFVDSNEEAKQMLINGTVDSADLPYSMRSELITELGLRIVEGLPTFYMDFLGFNWNISVGLDIGDVPNDFFADYKIRKAFAHAFDHDSYLEIILRGAVVQPNGPIPMGMFGYDPSVPNYTMNLSLSSQYLNGTGYGATGFHIILYYNAGNPEREAACLLLKEGLEAVPIAGEIAVEVMALDSMTYYTAMYSHALPVSFLGWVGDYADPDNYVNPFLHSNGYFPYLLSLSNETLDGMIIEAAMELNETLRAEMYLNISQATYDNAYYLWTDQLMNFHVERTWVTGYYFNPMHAGLYYYHLGTSNKHPIVKPSQPINLSAQVLLDRISLCWERPENNGSTNLTEYGIYRGASEESLTRIDSVFSNTTSWSDFEITEGVRFYAVSAVNEEIEGELSQVVSASYPAPPPSPPQDLSTMAGNSYVNLSWSAPLDDGGSPIDNYGIYRGLNSQSLSMLALVGDNLTFVDDTVDNGVCYYYGVTAFNDFGEGNLSNIVNATPCCPPTSPLNLTAEAGDCQISLTWDQPSDDGGKPITNYSIYRGTSSGKESLLITLPDRLNYTDEEVTNGQIYYYRICAVNERGEGELTSEISIVPMTVPTAPTDFQVVAGNENVTLTWSPSSYDGGSPIIKYTIYRGNASGQEIYLTEVSGQFQYTDSGLTDGQTYYYRISASNLAGEGNLSDEVSATPHAPSAPEGDTVLIIGIIGIAAVAVIAVAYFVRKRWSS